MTPGERILALWQSGELAATAAKYPSQDELATALGMTSAGLRAAIVRLRRKGHAIPPWPYTGSATQPQAANENTVDPRRWPSVAAFDADVPLPAIPEGHRVKGASTLIREDGSIAAQWIKTSAHHDEREDWLEAIRSLSETFAPPPAVEPPQHAPADLLNAFPVGDPHVGLLAWHEDAGENFDLKLAEQNLVAAFSHLVALAPPAREALLIYIGDNSHVDSQENTTTRGTRQDADGRTPKIARTILSTIRQNVATVLTKHERAHIIIERGNHDELISVMVALALSLYYENEPRVTVDTSPEFYHWYRFGSNLIGTHHGDKAKPEALLGVMANDRARDWGETQHRRFYCGHYHHLMTKEVPGVIVEYLPTLAASDAWHRSMGYRSGRAMYMDVLHRDYGHINRHIVGIQQLRAEAA